MWSRQEKKRVFVGMSGGVDSSVSAALLKKAGYDVTGVFIKVWQPDWIECSWKEERLEAMRAAAHLRIPFVTLDLEKEYKEEVIDYMIAEYRVGRTPNPDVMCNRHVKFGAFWRWAKANGADAIATGHYARVVGFNNNGAPFWLRKFPLRSPHQFSKVDDMMLVEVGEIAAPSGCENIEGDSIQKIASPHLHLAENNTPRQSESYKLMTGNDTNKDQSYFLWTLNQNDLSHVMFPVGNMTKPEVRKLAQKFRLPNAMKKDSQGLCFIGKVDVKEFLSHYIKKEPGNVLDERGKVVGVHNGSAFLTIGERHGFTITRKTPNDMPYFITDKDVLQNTITVSNMEAGHSLPGATKKTIIVNVSWVSGKAPEIITAEFSQNERQVLIEVSGQTVPKNDIFNLQARSRYRQPLQNIRIAKIGITETIVEFEHPQNTLTPGQSLVIYDGDTCLGGGIIS